MASSNRSLTRLAPTPTNISTKSDPEIEKNGTPASPATARAIRVLPVPGGPTRITPFGILAPTLRNLPGSDRNSTISASSSFSSSRPATSANVTFFASGVNIFAWLLPKFIMADPPPCWRFRNMIRKRTMAPVSRTGINMVNRVLRLETSSMLTVTS